LLAETAEAWSFRIRNGRLPLAGVVEVGPLLDALESAGGVASPEEFRPILSAARAVEAVRTALRPAETPRLASRRDALPPFEALLREARGIFASEGGLRDDASPALAGIRRRLRSRRAEVSRELQRILDARREVVNDPLVVMRNDRYCIPVLASARARVPGIVHDRSGSGQTVFVEPMEIIEPNNELALLAAEERREVERILTAFGRHVLESAPELRRAVAMLAELDALEAKVELGEISGGRLPEISDDASWTLARARHPLLDPRLAPLRRKVLGETRAERDAVPLDLELPAATRLLVVSGPNAGGKTVVLKTAGLLSLMAQAGLPVSAAPGTRLPVFRAVRTEIGDAQEILSDRSTFSSSMETLASILGNAQEGTLALIDEVGAATDPQEGSAISVAYLEAYLARGGRAIVTTHLSEVKDFAASRPDAVLAAMEYDEATGRPTYRLRPGLSGRSRALAVAREQGVPEEVLERAREILGEAWQRRDASEGQAEELIERLRRQEQAQATALEEAERAKKRLEAEREVFDKEKSRLLREGLERFERSRRELSRRVDAAIAELRRRAPTATAGDVRAAAARPPAADPLIAEARAQARDRSATLAAGDSARLRGLQAVGRIASLEGEIAWLEVDGKRLRVPRSELEPAEPQETREKPRARASVNRSAPAAPEEPAGEINVIGRRLEEAIDEVDRALDEALLTGAPRLRVIHGHGTGRLRAGLREHLRQHPAVGRVSAAEAREGGNGATIVEMK
jgi:DNA mismatch repair protein MutS2